MADEIQRIPLDGASRVTVETSGINVLVTWDETAEEIFVSGADLEHVRAADEIFLRGTFGRGERQGRGLEVSSDESKYRVAFGGGEIEHDRANNKTFLRWDFLGGRGSKKSDDAVISIVLPKPVTVSTIEVEKGNLELISPTGKVECSVKTGALRSTGGVADLTASAGSGETQISGLEGTLESMAGSGDVMISDAHTITNVKAGSGEVSLANVHGDAIKIMAGSGDVDVRDCSAEAFSCQTGSGDVALISGQLDRISVRCGSGDVEATTVFGPYEQSIVTGSGNVSLGVPRGLPVRFEAYTLGGDISSDIQLVSVGQRGPRSRRTRRQVGSVGTGEPRAEVNIKTASGDIRLHWLSASAVPVAGPAPTPVPVVPDVSEPPNPPEPSNYQPAESLDHDARQSGARDARGEILEALARGEITVEEADALLNQLESSGRGG